MNKRTYKQSYQENDLIGRGSFGTVNLVKSIKEKNVYVAKKVNLGNLSQKDMKSAQHEVKLLQELKHPNIVEFKECFLEEGLLITIMEYCEGGDLKELITKHAEKREYFDEKLILNWFLQTLFALDFVHQNKILHRDMKASNIFLKNDGTVKLGDFGIAKSLENTNQNAATVIGTPYYMSPEVCENRPYSYKSDVWALGCILYEMCALRNAFSAKNLLSLIYKIVRDDFDPLPPETSPEMAELIKMLLTKNEDQRPSLSEILEIPFIRKACLENVELVDGVNVIKKIPFQFSNPVSEMSTHISETSPFIDEQKEDKENSFPSPTKKELIDTLKVVDLLECSAHSEQEKESKILSHSQKQSLVVEFFQQEEKPGSKSDLKAESLSSDDQTTDSFVSFQLPESSNIPVRGSRNLQMNSFFKKGNPKSFTNSPQSSQSLHDQNQYEKQLRNIQRMIPKKSCRSLDPTLGMNEVPVYEPPKQQKEEEIPTVESKNERLQEMEKDLFDLTKESLNMSLEKTINSQDQSEHHENENKTETENVNEKEQDNLDGTCMSLNVNSQVNPMGNYEKGDLEFVQEEFPSKKGFEETESQIFENISSFSQSLTSTYQMQNTLKSTMKSKARNKNAETDSYEDDYEEEYEEDFEEDTEEEI